MASKAPETSSRVPRAEGSIDSGTRAEVTITTIAIGMLITKTQRQEKSTSRPPMRGPTAAAIPVRPDHCPTPRPRSSLRRVALMMARLPGVSNAPPIPWRKRAPMRSSTVGAMAESSDATANQTTPVR